MIKECEGLSLTVGTRAIKKERVIIIPIKYVNICTIGGKIIYTISQRHIRKYGRFIGESSGQVTKIGIVSLSHRTNYHEVTKSAVIDGSFRLTEKSSRKVKEGGSV